MLAAEPRDAAIRIPLANGLVALVDKQNQHLTAFRWHAFTSGGVTYARRCRRQGEHGPRFIYLHRAVLGVTDASVRVRHANGCGLDCRQANLQTGPVVRTIRLDVARGLWRAEVRANGRTVFLNFCTSAAEAERLCALAAARHEARERRHASPPLPAPPSPSSPPCLPPP